MAKIAIFGGSQAQEGDPVYQSACWLGSALAQSGHTVMTGGYIGVMEAASRGASEAGGHVIGVTCADIEVWRPVRANRWVKEEIRCTTLRERLNTIIDTCEAALVMPGGPGTLTEAALTWNLLLTESIEPRPLILVGPGWQATFETFFESLGSFIPNNQRHWLVFAPDVQSAFDQLIHLLPGSSSPVRGSDSLV